MTFAYANTEKYIEIRIIIRYSPDSGDLRKAKWVVFPDVWREGVLVGCAVFVLVWYVLGVTNSTGSAITPI